jgi:hypothetical protein
MQNLSFVSYDGEYPNLCAGTLILKLGDKEIIFPKYSLSSGGYVAISKITSEIGYGDWDIQRWPADFPANLKDYAVYLVNKNIR